MPNNRLLQEAMVDNANKPPKGNTGDRKRRTDATRLKVLDDLGEDAIIDMIREGKSYREIAALTGSSPSRISEWLAEKPERSARAQAARTESAAIEDDLALEVIRGLNKDSTKGDIARAREEAQHRRWRARVRDPKGYGDRVALDHGVSEDTDTLLGEIRGLLGGGRGGGA